MAAEESSVVIPGRHVTTSSWVHPVAVAPGSDSSQAVNLIGLLNHSPKSLEVGRQKMYALRSDILHGSGLMEMDLEAHFGWAPPEWNEEELLRELWGLTRIALRNLLNDYPLLWPVPTVAHYRHTTSNFCFNPQSVS